MFKKIIIALPLIAPPLIFTLSACEPSIFDTYKLMIEKYQNPEVFINCSGRVTSYDIENNHVYIRCYLNVDDRKEQVHRFEICSGSSLPLFENDFVVFKTDPHMFYDMYYYYIVEIIKDSETLLDFEVGQQYLLNSLNEKLKNR